MGKRRESIVNHRESARAFRHSSRDASIQPCTRASSSFKRTSFRIASSTHPVTASTLKTPSSASLCCNLYVSSPRHPSLRVSRPPAPLDVVADARTGGRPALLPVVILTRPSRTATRSVVDRGDAGPATAVMADDAFADMTIASVRSSTTVVDGRFKRPSSTPRVLEARAVRPGRVGQTVEFFYDAVPRFMNRKINEGLECDFGSSWMSIVGHSACFYFTLVHHFFETDTHPFFL